MKNILLIIAITIGTSTFAQDKFSFREAEKLTFYGVDFSNVGVLNVKEDIEDFKIAFNHINSLFITEPAKYNISNFLRKRTFLSLDLITEINKEAEYKDFYAANRKRSISKETIDECIKSLDIKQEGGIGLIFFAELLDRPAKKGRYKIVFFDINSREVLQVNTKVGKAQGFGLGNFWARSVLEVMKQL